ncbi:hypothetical protein Salat_1209300 [Sesamum alatum]|uniref:Retrovirus-related Pol polyprotein from transposon TNT 1-94-like beta-barrel domain-containing protein n=1 Tax=Sesamum alatum TaxID=300844 RepID=A0AAE2CNV7_9LAMI|nr:hypothetical protein Salat_1209300 [Sesamum alatum]
MVLMHNEQIKAFQSVANHLKLEADRRETERAQQASLVAHAGQHTGATKHMTRDRAGFVDYHRVPACSYYIAMGNGTQEEILGIGSYQLKLSTGRELLLSDVQYAPSI